MPGPVNPDGTVQVPGSPPLASAFGPASASAPPPPQAAPPQVQSTAPGFLDAIMQLLQRLAPQGLTQRKAATDDQVEQAAKSGPT